MALVSSWPVHSWWSALPALVPIAVVVIGAHWRRFKYERSEAFALLYAGIIVVAALSAAIVFAHRH
ncbi:MAG TPA: hypothetical protein VGS41_06375, partial [Chthonomonadales bacterium]|nr:hypothetical protein [Chthonomonadales bacterium]